LAELKREYARLSTTFNEDYPRVKEIQSQADEIAGRDPRTAQKRCQSDHKRLSRRGPAEDLVRQALRQEQKNMDQVAARAVQYKYSQSAK